MGVCQGSHCRAEGKHPHTKSKDIELKHATLWSAYGIQHNFERDSKEDEELRRRLKIVAQEMLEVDKIIQKGENHG